MMTHTQLCEAIRDQKLGPIESFVDKPNCGLGCVGTGEDFDRCEGCLRCGSNNGFATVNEIEERKSLPVNNIRHLSKDDIDFMDNLWDDAKGYHTDKGCSLAVNDKRKLMSEVCLRHTCVYGVINNG